MHLSRSYFLGSTILAGAIAFSVPAFAQQTPPSGNPPPGTQPAAAESSGSEVEAVVVTGSRIKNTAFNSASPVQIITSEQTELKGIPDAAQALLTSTAAAGSFQLNDQLTGFVTNGGGGTQSIALRGIGTQRTLTLLNGKRAGPAGTRGQVQAFDLNNIPQAQVDRFDILKDGASSIYGSDAVAGVVNIITKKNLNGGAVNFFASQPFDTGGGQYRVDATYGKTFDQGYFNVSAEYYQAKPLRRRERAETSCAQDYVFDLVTGERRDYVDPTTGEYKCYNLNTAYVQVVSTGANLMRIPTGPYTFPTQAQGNSNNSGTSTATPVPTGWIRWGRNGFPLTFPYGPYYTDIWKDSTVISPVVRQSVNFTGGWFLSPKAEIYTELLYNNRVSHQLGAAQIFPSFAQRNIVNGAPNSLPASNPNNEFGFAVVPVAPYHSDSNQDVDYYRGVLGLRGDFDLFRNWSYDLYAQYSLSDATYDNGPRLYLDRFLATMSPNVACENNPLGGNFSNFNCSALPNGVPWTSQRILEGNFNQAERDFLFINEKGTTTYEHEYVEGTVSTDALFAVPAGNVGAAFGFQVRREAIDDTPGFNAANRNIALFTSAGRTKGSDNISEAFGELEIPLFKDIPLAKAADLNISGRISDYKSYGTSKTYKVGLNWTLTDEYKFRASTGTSFRAPALYELFLGAQIGFGSQSANDPCFQYGTSGVETVVQNACAALGIPPDYSAAGSSSIPIASTGGAGILAAETAKTYNLGFVWTPKYMPLSVAIDYYSITIKNAVDQFGAFNIIRECLRGDTAFCAFYTRDPVTHYVTSVNNGYTNVSSQQNRGVDLQIRYRTDAPWNLGRLTIESTNNWKLEDNVTRISTRSDFLGDTFNFNGPQYAGSLNATLDKGSFTYFYGIDMIGHASDLVEGGGHAVSNSRYGDVLAGRNSSNCTLPANLNQCVYDKWTNDFQAYHSASVRYRHEGYTLQIGVNNLFDKGPPEINTGEFRVGRAMLNGYDMRGRRGFVRIGKTF